MKTVFTNPVIKRKGIFRLFHISETSQMEENVVSQTVQPGSLSSQRNAYTGNHFAGANALFDPRFFRKR